MSPFFDELFEHLDAPVRRLGAYLSDGHDCALVAGEQQRRVPANQYSQELALTAVKLKAPMDGRRLQLGGEL